MINPFQANVPILYPLKTPENQRISCIFRGYKMRTLGRNKLKRMFGGINIFTLIWPLHLIFVPLLSDHYAFVYIFVFCLKIKHAPYQIQTLLLKKVG